MPSEITGYLSLNQTSGVGARREVAVMMSLDEGFDRPFWKNVQGSGKTYIPSSPNYIFSEGLISLMKEAEREDSGHISHPENGDVLVPEGNSLIPILWSIPEGYSLSLHVFSTSSLMKSLEAFMELPVEKDLLVQVTPSELFGIRKPPQEFPAE